jgi:acetyltransferase (GNAT) family protein
VCPFLYVHVQRIDDGSNGDSVRTHNHGGSPVNELTYRWIDGPFLTDEEWASEMDRIGQIFKVRGWMTLCRAVTKIRIAEEPDGKIAGFIVLQLTPQCGPAYTAPAFRGTGLTEELADQMFNYLDESNVRGFFVVADSPYVPKLCEAHGMTKLKSPVYALGVTEG